MVNEMVPWIQFRRDLLTHNANFVKKKNDVVSARSLITKSQNGFVPDTREELYH